ncbi:MAG: hypothetical protein KKA90_04975 [Nanoarchaeota archaeon]|nr:hypothetical protein [Nanoarchaeota archaeon]
MKTQKRKGITPIIAIVILLLITIAIAGIAYTFITGVVTNTAGKTVRVTGATCANNGDMIIYFQNVGTETVTTNGDVTVENPVCVSGTGCFGTSKIAVWAALTVPGGDASSVTVDCADDGAVGANTATCKYDVVVGGTPSAIQQQCTDNV